MVYMGHITLTPLIAKKRGLKEPYLTCSNMQLRGINIFKKMYNVFIEKTRIIREELNKTILDYLVLRGTAPNK